MTDFWRLVFSSIIWSLATLYDTLITLRENHWLLRLIWRFSESVSEYESVFQMCVWITIHVFLKLLVPNGLPYMFSIRKYITNINSFVSIRHIWFCSILITLSSDIEKNPGPKPCSCEKFSMSLESKQHFGTSFNKNISFTCVYSNTYLRHSNVSLCWFRLIQFLRWRTQRFMWKYLFQHGILGQEPKRT